jgi:hypothetical protein
VSFNSLDELFELCLHISDSRLIERVVLAGPDDQGETRSVTFAFRAVTASTRL